jgi:4-hydroxybenzoate polyprenyltransferase
MAAAVLCWTAGFDIIYACQDYESDRQSGVFSIPAKFGIAGALWIARLTHAACVGLLALLAYTVPEFSVLFWIAIAIAAALLIVEHLIVKPNDLSKVGLAFFTFNGVIALVIGALGIADVYF